MTKSTGRTWQQIVDTIKVRSQECWKAISPMASIEGDKRTGGMFALYDESGECIDYWVVGTLTNEQQNRFLRNAENKCRAMHKHRVVCSGMVADPTGKLPIYDGGHKLSNGWYLAFSGLRAELDRVYCMLVAQLAKLLPPVLFATIMVKSPSEALCRALFIEAGLNLIGTAMKDHGEKSEAM